MALPWAGASRGSRALRAQKPGGVRSPASKFSNARNRAPLIEGLWALPLAAGARATMESMPIN
eukprot:2853478-Lingulodinium_polyedra.AAC.1